MFSVSGVGEETAIPNTALMSIGITKTTPTVTDAQNQANTVINKITEELKKLGVEEKNIKTTNYSVSPDYDYSPPAGGGKQTVKGYTVTENLEVRITPIEKANSAADIATANGANLVGGITFVLDEQTQEKMENEARKQAIEKAKKKAQALADAAGIRLGKIVDVQESNNGNPRIMPYALDAQKTASSIPTNLSPGENKVTVTITLSYETY